MRSPTSTSQARRDLGERGLDAGVRGAESPSPPPEASSEPAGIESPAGLQQPSTAAVAVDVSCVGGAGSAWTRGGHAGSTARSQGLQAAVTPVPGGRPPVPWQAWEWAALATELRVEAAGYQAPRQRCQCQGHRGPFSRGGDAAAVSVGAAASGHLSRPAGASEVSQGGAGA